MTISIEEIHALLDMRSDTGTLPSQAMWEAMSSARLGDGGRVDITGRGEDPTVYELEMLGASITGKDDGIFLPSGTLANHVALYTCTERGDKVLLESQAHIFNSEKSGFMPRYGGLEPVFFHLTDDFQVDRKEVERLLEPGDIRLLCLENTHNASGGTCLTPETTRIVCELAHAKGVHVHLDGARIFNAAVVQGVDVKELAGPVDSLMFCVSKGLSAPVGSVLTGSAAFIKAARVTCKYLGTSMRQSGIVAAAGIVALQENIARLGEDHENAAFLGARVRGIGNVGMNPASWQSNFVCLDVTPAGITPQQAAEDLRARGLLVSVSGANAIRLVASRGLTRADMEKAAAILAAYFGSLSNR